MLSDPSASHRKAGEGCYKSSPFCLPPASEGKLKSPRWCKGSWKRTDGLLDLTDHETLIREHALSPWRTVSLHLRFELMFPVPCAAISMRCDVSRGACNKFLQQIVFAKSHPYAVTSDKLIISRPSGRAACLPTASILSSAWPRPPLGGATRGGALGLRDAWGRGRAGHG